MSFEQFAQAHGLIIKQLYPSPSIKRCGTVNKPRSTNGAYFFDGDRGWVFRWDDEATVQWWNDPNAKPWTEQEKSDFKRKQLQAAKAKREEQAQVAKMAESILSECEMLEHGYLTSKGFATEKGLVRDGILHVPMRNVRTNALQGLQRIYLEDGSYVKKMMTGMAAKEAVFWIGARKAQVVILCEGYATGLSILAAARMARLNASVLVCFSAYNLQQVASMVPGQRVVFADNDASGAGQKAAEATGLPWVMSDLVGEDANDLHVRCGVFEVIKKLQEAIAK